jgi:kynurenine aminotransferase
MWERTVTFGSGGKSFGVTGWRIGWIIAHEKIIKPILAIHARTVFTTPTPLQDAVASGLENAMVTDYFEKSRAEYQKLRDQALGLFTDLGLPVAIPHGGYFFMVDTSKIQVDLPPHRSEETNDPDAFEARDYAICRWLTTEFGVTAIPPSAFYSEENKPLAENMIRICFCKTGETIETARGRLQALKKFIKN